MNAIDTLVSQWTRLGTVFNARPAAATPDLEEVILQTARCAQQESRLFIMAATWLARDGLLVAHHRLRQMTVEQLDPEPRARLGLLIETAASFQPSRHLQSVLEVCRPMKFPRPLFDVHHFIPGLNEWIQEKASPLSRKWGLWCEEIQPKDNALRSIEWILGHNPSLRLRAVFQGGLRASILACLAADQTADGCSEADLARRCGATRKAVHEALDHLQFCGLVRRVRKGRSYRVGLCEPGDLRLTG